MVGSNGPPFLRHFFRNQTFKQVERRRTVGRGSPDPAHRCTESLSLSYGALAAPGHVTVNGLPTGRGGSRGSCALEPRDGSLEGELATIQRRSSNTQGKPAFGRESEDPDRRGGECRGVWAQGNRDPGRRRPQRLGQGPEVGDDWDPVGQPGHHAPPPGADPVRVRLEENV